MIPTFGEGLTIFVAGGIIGALIVAIGLLPTLLRHTAPVSDETTGLKPRG